MVGHVQLNSNARPVDRVIRFLRTNGRHVLIEALVNFILPYAIYAYAEAPLGQVWALLLSSAPPVLWSLIEFARNRRLDAISVFVLSGIALSLLAMFGGGGVRMLQLREKLVTAVIGLALVGSVLIGKPLIFELARATLHRRSPDEAEVFERLQAYAGFRRTMLVMTLVWGLGLVADAALSAVMVFTLSVRANLIAGPALGYATMGLLGFWSYLYGQNAKHRAAARRAAMDAQDAGNAVSPKRATLP